MAYRPSGSNRNLIRLRGPAGEQETALARFVLVHGAFHGAWCWEPLILALSEAGHTTHALDLPGAGEDATPVGRVTLDAYAERICERLGFRLGQLRVRSDQRPGAARRHCRRRR